MQKVLAFLRNCGDHMIRWLLMGLIRIAFRPQVYFISEKARQEAFCVPTVVISNHIRGLDGAVVATLFPGKKIHGLVALDMYDNRALGWLLRRLRCIPVDRRHVSLDWLRQGRRTLNVQGEHIFICPEGKCNRQKIMQPFKPGAVMLAAMAGAPILPVYHNGEYNYLFGKRFRCMVGEPVYISMPEGGASANAFEANAHRMEEIMTQLMQALDARRNFPAKKTAYPQL